MDQHPVTVPKRVTPYRGFAWAVQSMAILQLQAGRLLLIAVLLQLILGLTQVPLLGLLVVICVPGLSAGILEAFHQTAKGGRPVPSLMFTPLASAAHRGRMLKLGVLIFAVGILAISVLMPGAEQLPDQELLMRIQQGDMDAVAQLNPDFIRRTLFAFMVGVAISGTLSYFTIPLVWFHNHPLGSALKAGLRALVINWKPFLVLAVVLAAVFLPIAIIIGILLGFAMAGGLASVIIMGLVMMLLLLFQLLLFGTQYCAFREIFGMGDEEQPDEPEESGQLLA
jgi:hypothetical protein